MNYARTLAVMALVGWFTTGSIAQTSEGTSRELAQSYSAIAGNSEQGTGFGWVSPTTQSGDSEPLDADARTETGTGTDDSDARTYSRAIAEPERAARRESLRRAYRGQTNPYARAGQAEVEHKCEICGEDCKCPPHVCDAGDCKKNYVAMFSAPWCAPCRAMYPILKKMRADGYIVYFYDVTKFEDIDAQYDVNSVPTFIIFDKGKEVTRNIGTVAESWFHANLKKRDEQVDPEPDPTPKPDSNPYDGLFQ